MDADEGRDTKSVWMEPPGGKDLRWRVEQTLCNGHLVYDRGTFDEGYRGEELEFDRTK